jgi:RNA polymerase sigma-70 factor, ECF subfamily
MEAKMIHSTCSTSLPASSHITSSYFKPSDTQAAINEAEVVAQAKEGDDDAFKELYLKYRTKVFSICLRAVRDFSLAEDLTQETFLQLHRKIASFRGESAFSTWLHRMAVNTVLMHVRKGTLSLISLDHLATEVPDERGGIEFGCEDLRQSGAIDRLTIERAMAGLAPGYRAVFEFHDVQGFDHHEIAAKMNCTVGCTKSQLHHARRTLRHSLSPKSHSSLGGRKQRDLSRGVYQEPQMREA